MSDKIWVIIRENGDHFILEKEPLDGITAWAEGQTVTVREYTFSRVVYDKRAAPLTKQAIRT